MLTYNGLIKPYGIFYVLRWFSAFVHVHVKVGSFFYPIGRSLFFRFLPLEHGILNFYIEEMRSAYNMKMVAVSFSGSFIRDSLRLNDTFKCVFCICGV